MIDPISLAFTGNKKIMLIWLDNSLSSRDQMGQRKEEKGKRSNFSGYFSNARNFLKFFLNSSIFSLNFFSNFTIFREFFLNFFQTIFQFQIYQKRQFTPRKSKPLSSAIKFYPQSAIFPNHAISNDELISQIATENLSSSINPRTFIVSNLAFEMTSSGIF